MIDETTRVLVVDDDDSARRMMRRALERRGYRVMDESNGRAGLDCMRADRPDIVLLDLRMPGDFSGVDVIRAAQADPQLRSMPIIVVTASAHHGAHDLVNKLDCAGFIEKPVDLNELYEIIERVLKLAEIEAER